MLYPIIYDKNETAFTGMGLAVLHNVISPLISEKLDQTEKIFSFSTVVDEEKSQYVQHENKVLIDGDAYTIIYTKENHNEDDTLTIDAACEHVSYELSDEDNVLEYFTGHGTATQLMTQALQGTQFSVGTVEFLEEKTISIQEPVTRRGVIFAIAKAYGGELVFNKYTVSLLVSRGADRGVQFRYGKNIQGISRTVDGRKKVDGLPAIAYEVKVPMLESLPEYGALEHVENGDTIKVYDEKLGIDVIHRVVSIAYDPIERMNLEVQIANYIPTYTDTISSLQQKMVAKETVYNGCHIGPENGFEAVRSDNKVRTLMNATEGISVQHGDGTSWSNVFYVDTEGNLRMKDAFIELVGELATILIDPDVGISIENENGLMFYIDPVSKKLKLVGEAEFSGTISTDADAKIGSNITIGSVNEDGNKAVLFFGDLSSGTLINANRTGGVHGLLIRSANNLTVMANAGTLKLSGMSIVFEGPVSGLTEQEFVKETFVNNLMAQHIAQYHNT